MRTYGTLHNDRRDPSFEAPHHRFRFYRVKILDRNDQAIVEEPRMLALHTSYMRKKYPSNYCVLLMLISYICTDSNICMRYIKFTQNKLTSPGEGVDNIEKTHARPWIEYLFYHHMKKNPFLMSLKKN